MSSLSQCKKLSVVTAVRTLLLHMSSPVSFGQADFVSLPTVSQLDRRSKSLTFIVRRCLDLKSLDCLLS